jgi:hypothetical protein
MSAWDEYKKNLGDTRPWHMLTKHNEYVPNEISEPRMAICTTCPELIKATRQCKKCGCFMNLKSKLPEAVCPLGKW